MGYRIWATAETRSRPGPTGVVAGPGAGRVSFSGLTPQMTRSGNAAWQPSYTLPSSGQYRAISSSVLADATPSGMSSSMWEYATVNSYGAGCMVDEYSSGGAYIVAGSGGHGSPANVGALVIDYTDGLFKRVNAVGASFRDSDYDTSETTGSPNYEITGSNGVPTPRHPYQQLTVRSTAKGGGTKGSVMYVGGAAMTSQSVTTGAIHSFDLATGVWSRLASTLAIPTASASVVRDETRDRWWYLPDNNESQNKLYYLDGADMTVKSTATYNNATQTAVLSANGRAFMLGGLLFRQGISSSLVVFDPDNPTAGWVQCQVTGSMPDNTDAFVYFPPSGKLYWISRTGGATLKRLTPPVNWTAATLKSGTWTVDDYALSSGSLPTRPNAAGPAHYCGLHYVRSVQRLGWFAGGSSPPGLLMPE